MPPSKSAPTEQNQDKQIQIQVPSLITDERFEKIQRFVAKSQIGSQDGEMASLIDSSNFPSLDRSKSKYTPGEQVLTNHEMSEMIHQLMSFL